MKGDAPSSASLVMNYLLITVAAHLRMIDVTGESRRENTFNPRYFLSKPAGSQISV